MGRFELPTPCSQSRCASQTALHPGPHHSSPAPRPGGAEIGNEPTGLDRPEWSARPFGSLYTLGSVKSTVEALEGNKVKVVVEVEEGEFEKDLDAAFRRLAREVRLPGFRPGKAPRKVLEARIGQSHAREEAFRQALPVYYAEAVNEHEVDVIAPPAIDITNGRDEGSVTFDAVVEIRPSVTVEGYSGLRVEVPSLAVTEEQIDASVDRMRGRFGELVTVERPAATGDRAVIDIEAIHEGESVPGLTASEYVYEVGSGAVVAEIDEHLLGASAGDELTFTAEHPDEDEGEPLEFTITVKEIQENVLPEPTDAWVKDNSEFETLDELRDNFRSNMATVRINQAQAVRRAKLAEGLANLVDDELVPEAMVDLEVDNRAQEMAMRLNAQGIDLNMFLQLTGQSQADVLEGLKGDARSAAKYDLALRAIAEAERLEVTEHDIDHEFEHIASHVDRTPEQVRAEFEQNGRMSALRADLAKTKALELVSQRADLVDEDGQPVSPDALELPTEHESGEDD
jgi:trigger factor